MPFLTSLRRTFFSAKDADCPALHAGTEMRLRSIDRMDVDVNCPRLSGPMTTLSPAWMTPDLTTPLTTVPTKGTEKVSLTWNSKGASMSYLPWCGMMLRKVRTRSRDCPVTLETWKMGQIRCETN